MVAIGIGFAFMVFGFSLILSNGNSRAITRLDLFGAALFWAGLAVFVVGLSIWFFWRVLP